MGLEMGGGGGGGGGGGHSGQLPPPPSQNEVGQIINLSQVKIGGNNFKKKTYAI
jgi:hypothetical protein